ncbi:Hypothetical predicted protein [Mytilus galloprovincialis]|uniref:Homeobox domain-containing protein n=1 Tax=Mytilus galloprovincialis TaxID=29158 RepID=A0A8B6BGU6_MYTGA|nr:Hypothetical predicted protein [Mytilus galloprovincialis]
MECFSPLLRQHPTAFRQPPTAHYSAAHYSDSPLLRQHIIPTATLLRQPLLLDIIPTHYSDSPLFRQCKRSREDYSHNMNVKLEEAWKGGMKYAGKRCKDEIEEVANSLAISTERVKEWIGNRNAKERRENGEGKPMKRKAAITTGTNSYALFAKTVKGGGGEGPAQNKDFTISF